MTVSDFWAVLIGNYRLSLDENEPPLTSREFQEKYYQRKEWLSEILYTDIIPHGDTTIFLIKLRKQK